MEWRVVLVLMEMDLWIACLREAGTKPSAGDMHTMQRIDGANESFMVENSTNQSRMK